MTPSCLFAASLTPPPDNEPRWVSLYVTKISEACAGMLLSDDVALPEPGRLPASRQFFFAVAVYVHPLIQSCD
jgi:hypothetical protein